jgi:hypothetical protein
VEIWQYGPEWGAEFEMVKSSHSSCTLNTTCKITKIHRWVPMAHPYPLEKNEQIPSRERGAIKGTKADIISDKYHHI